jgi:ribose 5-phosphate isomerase B
LPRKTLLWNKKQEKEEMIRIAIASDHAGFKLKDFLIQTLGNKYDFIDLGTTSEAEGVDYNDYAEKVVKEVMVNNIFGVLVCGTGIGMSIAANRHKGIRASLCDSSEAARLTREHNDANVLVLSGIRDFELSAKILETFISTNFSNEERHIRRVKKLSC